MITTTRQQRRQLERDNAKQPVVLEEIPIEQWLNIAKGQSRIFRSRDFLVQEFPALIPAVVRLSVCRTTLNGERWKDGVSWDDLQRLKRECGYGDRDAIEIYPSDADVVNVANMRHIWVMAEPVPCAWRKPSNAVLSGKPRTDF